MASVDNGELEAPPPPPPAAVNVWEPSEGQTVHYLIRSPWQWVMREIKKKPMVEVESAQQLPSSKLVGAAATSAGIDTPSSTPSTRRRRQKGIKDKINGPSALKIEVSHDETGEILFAVHGTSSALDGLEDKDELVRTIQRCRCEQLNLSPPSYLINWDVTREECFNVVGNALPTLESNTSKEIFAVLKEPMGSQGSGIFFVKDAEEIHRIIDEHRQRALEEPHFLDNLIAAKGRIPSWGEFYFSSMENWLRIDPLVLLLTLSFSCYNYSLTGRGCSAYANTWRTKVPRAHIHCRRRAAPPSRVT